MTFPVSIWLTPGLTERLKELHADKKMYSNGEIAHMLSREFEVSLSRNSIIGKVARLKLPLRFGAQKGGGSKPRNGEPGKRPEKVKKVQAKPVVPHVRAPPAVPQIPVERPGSMSLLELRADDCLWPFGDGPSYTFCGLPCVPGYPYCEEHLRRAHNEPREGRT